MYINISQKQNVGNRENSCRFTAEKISLDHLEVQSALCFLFLFLPFLRGGGVVHRFAVGMGIQLSNTRQAHSILPQHGELEMAKEVVALASSNQGEAGAGQAFLLAVLFSVHVMGFLHRLAAWTLVAADPYSDCVTAL